MGQASISRGEQFHGASAATFNFIARRRTGESALQFGRCCGRGRPPSAAFQRRRRGIFVEPQSKQNFSPVGAAYPDDVAPTELDSSLIANLQICQPYGLFPPACARWITFTFAFAIRAASSAIFCHEKFEAGAV